MGREEEIGSRIQDGAVGGHAGPHGGGGNVGTDGVGNHVPHEADADRPLSRPGHAEVDGEDARAHVDGGVGQGGIEFRLFVGRQHPTRQEPRRKFLGGQAHVIAGHDRGVGNGGGDGVGHGVAQRGDGHGIVTGTRRPDRQGPDDRRRGRRQGNVPAGSHRCPVDSGGDPVSDDVEGARPPDRRLAGRGHREGQGVETGNVAGRERQVPARLDGRGLAGGPCNGGMGVRNQGEDRHGPGDTVILRYAGRDGQGEDVLGRTRPDGNVPGRLHRGPGADSGPGLLDHHPDIEPDPHPRAAERNRETAGAVDDPGGAGRRNEHALVGAGGEAGGGVDPRAIADVGTGVLDEDIDDGGAAHGGLPGAVRTDPAAGGDRRNLGADGRHAGDFEPDRGDGGCGRYGEPLPAVQTGIVPDVGFGIRGEDIGGDGDADPRLFPDPAAAGDILVGDIVARPKGGRIGAGDHRPRADDGPGIHDRHVDPRGTGGAVILAAAHREGPDGKVVGLRRGGHGLHREPVRSDDGVGADQRMVGRGGDVQAKGSADPRLLVIARDGCTDDLGVEIGFALGEDAEGRTRGHADTVGNGRGIGGRHPVYADGSRDAGTPRAGSALAVGTGGFRRRIRVGCVEVVLGLGQGFAAAGGRIRLGLGFAVPFSRPLGLALAPLGARPHVHGAELLRRGSDGHGAVRHQVPRQHRRGRVDDDVDADGGAHRDLFAGHTGVDRRADRPGVPRPDSHVTGHIEGRTARTADPGRGRVVGKGDRHRRADGRAARRPGLDRRRHRVDGIGLQGQVVAAREDRRILDLGARDVDRGDVQGNGRSDPHIAA